MRKSNSLRPIIVGLALVMMFTGSGQAQRTANYEESDVPPYSLPDLLITRDGKKITTAAEWTAMRRPEVLEMFSSLVYGKVPAQSGLKMEFLELKADHGVLDGAALRKEIILRFVKGKLQHSMTLLLYLPEKARGRVPVFLGLNFRGNHTISPDAGISITKSWVPDNVEWCVVDNAATALSRGADSASWPVQRILERGYGLATMYYGDIDPDFDDGFQNGIHPLFNAKGRAKPAADEWGAIAAWAWGLSRALDYLETDPGVDAKKVAVLGHSRLGKTALWAGAADERFAIVISNNSGCGGAALSKRIFGETVGIINNSFPHWFCGNFKKFGDNEGALPVDQHMLLALIAPRPLYVASAEQDRWADPKGEYLAAYHAGPAYRLFRSSALASETMPPLNQPIVHQDVGYHYRSGAHNLSRYDWERYMDFADRHFHK